MARGFDPSSIQGPNPSGYTAGWSMLSNAIATVGARRQQREMAAAEQAHAGAMQRASQAGMAIGAKLFAHV